MPSAGSAACTGSRRRPGRRRSGSWRRGRRPCRPGRRWRCRTARRWFAGLWREGRWPGWGNVSLELLCACCREDVWEKTYAALDGSDKKALEDLAGLVAVADVLECLGRVLAADVEHHFLAAGVLVYEACWCAGAVSKFIVAVRLLKDVLFGMGWRGSDRKRRETYWSSRRPCRG
jgi:hypothetical protein